MPRPAPRVPPATTPRAPRSASRGYLRRLHGRTITICSRRARRLDSESVRPVPLPRRRAGAALVRHPAGRRDSHRHTRHTPPAGVARARSDPRRRRGDLGRARRRHRRAALPRRHGLVGVLGPPVGHPADPAGRTRHLRRDPRRGPGRCNRRAASRGAAARDPRLRRARDGAGTGPRTLRQLLQPGAVRRADEPPVGPRDRPRSPAGAVPRPTRPSSRRSCTSRSGT